MTGLFDTPASRRTDPNTSKRAEREFTKSGARKSQAERVLAVIRSVPGETYSEIAWHAQLQPIQVMRRLNDLEKAGLIHKSDQRKCRVTGSVCSTWRPGASHG